MNESLKILILDNVKSIRSRVKSLLNPDKYTIYEASNATEFLNIFAQHGHNSNLIIMDIDLKDEDGFEIVRKIREKNKVVPIIVLTANNHKTAFLKGILEGISDYILKPFEDEILINKILKFLNSSENLIADKIILNLPFFIHSEFRKATKGNYNVTTMMTTLYKSLNTNSNEIDNEYNEVSDYVYDHLKNIFWDTDVFIHYALHNFIGVFPFASAENKSIINDKVNEYFEDLKLKNPKLKEYSLSNVFVTYPQDIEEDEDIFSTLLEKTKEALTAHTDI